MSSSFHFPQKRVDLFADKESQEMAKWDDGPLDPSHVFCRNIEHLRKLLGFLSIKVASERSKATELGDEGRAHSVVSLMPSAESLPLMATSSGTSIMVSSPYWNEKSLR